MVFSIGTTLTVGCTFIRDGLFQAVMTSASNLLGSKNHAAWKRLVLNAFVFHGMILLMLVVPFLIYPEKILSFFFATRCSESQVPLLLFVCYSIWVFFLLDGIRAIGMGLLAASRHTAFFIFTGCMAWVSGYLPTYLALEIWQWPAETLWLVSSFNAIVVGTLYFLRAVPLFTQTPCKQVPLQ